MRTNFFFTEILATICAISLTVDYLIRDVIIDTEPVVVNTEKTVTFSLFCRI